MDLEDGERSLYRSQVPFLKHKTCLINFELHFEFFFFFFFEGRQFQRLMCNGWTARAEANSRSYVGHSCWFAAQRQATCPDAFFLSIWSFIYKVGIWHFSFYVSERGCVICRTLIFSSRNWLPTVLYVQLLMVWLDYFSKSDHQNEKEEQRARAYQNKCFWLDVVW